MLQPPLFSLMKSKRVPKKAVLGDKTDNACRRSGQKHAKWAANRFIILSDSSKAFDKVAHEKILLELHYHGIRDGLKLF